MDALDPTAYVTSSELEGALGKALQQQEETFSKHEEALRRQSEALAASERSLQEFAGSLSDLDGKVASMSEEMARFTDKIKEMEVSEGHRKSFVCRNMDTNN